MKKNTLIIEIKDQETKEPIETISATYCVMYHKQNRTLIQYREMKLYNDNEPIETSTKEREIYKNQYVIITEIEQYYKDALERAKKEQAKCKN